MTEASSPAATAVASPTPAATATAAVTATPVVTATPSPSLALGTAPTGVTQAATVVRVVDGDTIRVQLDGVEYRVRYIGIDTPETVHPSRPVEWMGREASAANRQLVDGRTVILEKDVSESDRYGRLLRYVWLRDGAGWLMVNAELVARGFAQVSTYPPDVKYTDLFLDLQRAARDGGLGLWGDPPDEDEEPDDDEESDDEAHRFDGDHDGLGCESG
ncbi:MAG: thermonuclease family protein [Chloroflexota bacterium]|nr:thermonuclease family protein [Chloroflexota bacterium]